MSKSKKRIRTKKLLNTLVVIIVITLFISTAIIAIIYTQGGKITRTGIQETGSVRLVIQPDDKDHVVYVDDKVIKIDERLINNLTPGLHTIKIESIKFHSWEKEIEVYPSYVTTMQVKLFPLEPELTQLTQTNISKLFFAQDGSHAYYLVDDPLVELPEQGLWKVRLEEQDLFFRRDSEPEKIADMNEPVITYLSSPDVKVNIDSNNNKLLISDTKSNTIILFDPTKSNVQERFKNLKEHIGFFPTRVEWFNNNNSVIASNDEIIIEFNTVNLEKTVVEYVPSTEPIFDTNSNILYFYSSADKKIKLYQNKISREIQLPANFPINDIDNFTLSRDGSVLIFNAGNNYYHFEIDDKIFTLVNNGGEILDISYDGSSFLFDNNGNVNFVIVEQSLIDDSMLVQSKVSNIDVALKPKFINNSNLVIINNHPLKKMQICENDGTNLIDILSNTTVDNGYYKFQLDGSSLSLMIEDSSVDNILNKNIFKLVLNSSSLPFNL